MSCATTPSVPDLLKIDPALETEKIAAGIREVVLHEFRRKGAVVAVSGGIDSSVVVALCTRALGPHRVLALLLPEADSSDDSERLAMALVERLGIAHVREDIRPILEAAGCYRRRDECIRSAFPAYGPGYKSKIVLPDLINSDRYAIFSLVVQSPSGETHKVRLPLDAYLGIVAATNFKQRTRKMMEYFYADRYQYAVSGTPNRLEFDQGFFVKNGDGAADFKPIAHLYKSQVYQLAAYLDIPEEIQSRPPTTDTYSLPQSQEEFYFSVPLHTLDLCLYAKDYGMGVDATAQLAGLTAEQVRRMFEMIDAKRRMAYYLHQPPKFVCSF